uniref:Synaptobrevin, longin-like domain protein n=1 Tax=Tanacetum cinerariifolium TaxID=118510 RepID=A0A6L2KNR6_TANCI|nr:hypothetical protein [Tanacetum cinerariifolium]
MLHLLRVEMVINSPWMISKNWLVQKQTDFGKDISNSFMADNLLKIVWFSTHRVTCMKSWLVQQQTALGQTATSKESLNPFMSGAHTPRSDEDSLKLIELMVFWLQKDKSDAAEGFEQIIDFLSGSYIHYALTMNPHIYILCIKQFWNTASVKRSTDVTRLQALVDKKKIVISEVIIREILQLDDVEGVVCLSNEEILAGLAQMGYEKPSTRLTFYKAFFSSQWKFLIHTLLQLLSAKRTFWNEFSTEMASAVICLSKGQKFNFSKYIFDSLVRNVDSSSKFYMVGKGFSGVETPLFEGMLAASHLAEEEIAEEQVQATGVVAAAVQETIAEEVVEGEAFPAHFQQVLDVCSALTRRVEHLEYDNIAQKLEIVTKGKRKEGRMINEDEGIELVKDADIADTEGRHAEKQAEIYNLDLDHSLKVLSMQEDDSEVQEVVEVVTTTKLITDVVIAATSQVSAVSATIPAAKPSIPAAAPTVVAAYTRRRKSTESEAQKNTMDYLKNTEGFKMDFFKGMSYDEIRPLFQSRFDANMRFLPKSGEEMEEEDQEIIKSINETPAQKAAKRRKPNE